MASYKKKAKCPQCLPDIAGAIFTKRMGEDGWYWECNNCHHKAKCQKHKPTQKVSQSQQKWLDLLTAKGWTLETNWVNSSGVLWVVGKKDRGSVGMNLIAGDSFYGTIGSKGKLKLTLQRLGKDVVITCDIGISVYL